MCDIEDENLRPEEKNPEWLLSKGDTFWRQENYQAAINAYTHGIRLGGKSPLPQLLSRRADCHLQLRNLHKALEDSSRALELLTPPVPQNAADRKWALTRRGAAFQGLQCYVEALVEFEAAFQIDRADEEVEKKIGELRKIIQGNEEETRRKERRDAARGDAEGGTSNHVVANKTSATISTGDDEDDDDEEDKTVTHMNVDEFHEKQRERKNNLVIEDHK